MTTRRRFLHKVQRAFTLIELMIVIALVGVILLLVAPNMTEMIGMQRLRAINDQLVTDLHYMRGEAVSRNQFMAFLARSEASDSMSCYVIFSSAADPLNPTTINPAACTCTNAIGSVCTGTQRELRTVQIPRSLSIDLRFPPGQGRLAVASPVSGGAVVAAPDTGSFSDLEFCIEVRRTPRGRLRTGINLAGRTQACSPDGSVPGVAVCPPYDATLKNCQGAS